MPPGYTHVVEVNGPGRTIYIAGQLGYDSAGQSWTANLDISGQRRRRKDGA
jgi:enamine deaminase RidA (YjgF/YER057c/UK114 family)